jgi:hypothetical protein
VNLKKPPFPDEWSQVAPILSWVEGDGMGTNWMELYEREKLPAKHFYDNFGALKPMQFACEQERLITFCSPTDRPSVCAVCYNKTSMPI